MQFRIPILVLILFSAASCQEGQAQAIKLNLSAVSLEEALLSLRTQAGVDVVFAQRLVQNQTVSCRYDGEQVEEALACVLENAGLRAEQIRKRQYVVLEAQRKREPAQTGNGLPRGMLAGFVSDVESGEMLPGAHVYLSGLGLGAITNAGGYFAIPALPQGRYGVRISYVGYHTLDSTLAVGAGMPLIRLSPVPLQSEGVVIESSSAARPDLAAVPGVLALPVQDLEKLPSFPGEKDLFQALQWMPGVQRSGEVTGGLIVRGGETDQNLYLLDGAPVYHPWHAFSLISTFQTETFKDVRLYRGSFPAEHGGRLASVLEAQMKDGSRVRPGGVAALSLLSGRLMVESPITRNVSFMVSGRRSYIDQLIGRKHPVEENGRRDTLRTGYYFYDLSAKLTLHAGVRHQFSVSHYRGKDFLDLRLPFDLSLDFSSWLRPADLFFEVDQNWGNQLYSFRHQYLRSRRFFLTTTGFYSGYTAHEGAFIQPSSSASLRSNYRVRVYDLGLKVDADYYHSLYHQVRAGVQAVNHNFRSVLDATVERSPGAVDSLDEDSRLHAWEVVAYMQDTWQPSPRWQILPGLRLSTFSGGAYVHVNPRVSVQYAVEPKRFFVRGAVGTQVQYMHRLRDRYSFTYDMVSSRWIPASAGVRPSASIQAAGGIESYPFSWLALSSDIYWRHSNNILLPEDEYRTKDGLEGPGIEVGALLGQYVPARAHAYGVEAAARIEKAPWRIWLNYSGGRALNRTLKPENTRYRPSRYDAPRSFQSIVSFTRNRWTATVSSEVRSGYPLTVPVARYALADPLDETPTPYLYRPRYNNGRLPPYMRLDLTLGYRFSLFGAAWQSQIELYNAFNKRNVVDRLYDPAPTVVQYEDRRGLPRLILLELELAF